MQSLRERITLDGEWKLVLDPENVGVKKEWFQAPPPSDALTVTVPAVWDLWVPDYDGAGWYYRTFEVPEGWADRQTFLHFEAADYYAEVWVNASLAGAHEGGYTPFEFDVTPLLKPGANTVAVRILDPHGPEGIEDFRPKEIPSSKEGGYWSFAGLWGSVFLESRSHAHIEDVFVTPDLRRKRITVQVSASVSGTISLAVQDTGYIASGVTGTEIHLEMSDFTAWSPQTPHLYTLQCKLEVNGVVSEEVSVRFGMREFTVKENRFHLNGHPLIVKAILHQPDYARSLAAPESEAIARKEIEAAKAAGFNMMRLHIKTPPRITLDLADELGMLLYEEPPIGWIKNSDSMKNRCMNEVREMILRDRNHPSVVIWGMLNESGNAEYKTMGGAQIIKDDLALLARSLDPSRLIIDDSGGVNATREPARMLKPFRTEFEVYDDLHIYQRAPVDREIELYYMHSGEPEQLFFLSEFGFGGMEDLESTIAQYGENPDKFKDARFLKNMLEASLCGFTERGLDRVFGGFAQFTAAARELQCDAIRHQVDAMRGNPKLAGYCYTQLCDAGHEFCAGILDRWRRPKPALEVFREVQQPMRPLIQMPRTNLMPREEIPVTVLLANEQRLEGFADLSLQVVGPTNQVLWKKKRSMKIPRHCKELWVGSISASGSSGTHKFVVRVMQGLKCLGSASSDFHVYDPATPADVEVNLLDPTGEWRDRCTKLATLGRPDSPVHVIPPLGNTIRAYPDNELAQVLAQVKEGAVAIMFAPPDDWNDFADTIDPGIRATSKDAVGAFLGMYHYVKMHPVFDGLPSRCLMRQPYSNTVPPRTFLESGEEDICGTFDTTPIASGNYMMGETRWWGSDILVRKHGLGRIVFTHLKVMENLGQDPVADHLFVNLLKHFSLRSVPTRGVVPLDQKSVEWLRLERTEHTHRWMVIGPFPNWGGKGHDTPYPPEKGIQTDATYPGWYKALSWKPWHTCSATKHKLDLQEAFTPVYEYYPRFDCGVGYAYAECLADRKQMVAVEIGLQNATKIWINGILVLDYNKQIPHDEWETDRFETTMKQGKNTILVKVSKNPGPFAFSFDLRSTTKDTLQAKWLK